MNFNFLWILSAVLHRFLIEFYKGPGPDYEGAQAYFVFYILFIILCLFVKNKEIKINKYAYLLGCLILISPYPLMENDHYRYFFEAKALFSGISPYNYSPQEIWDIELLHINFEHFNSIGFPEVSSSYPPAMHLWHGFFSFLPFAIGFTLLQLTYSLMLHSFLNIVITRSKIKDSYIFLCIPLLQKEVISSAHIDALAAFSMIYFIHNNKYFHGAIAAGLVKLVGFFLIPWIILRDGINVKKIVVTLIAFVYFIFTIRSNGFQIYSNYWEWNPSIFKFFQSLFNDEIARSIYKILTIVIILTWTWVCRFKTPRSILLLFACLFLISPVYNSWYSLWILLPGLYFGSGAAVLASCLSIFSYSEYGLGKDYRLMAAIISHAGLLYLVFVETFIIKGISSNKNYIIENL